jgi:hypothetical protein
MAAWEKVTTGLDHGGYVAWESALATAQGPGARDHLPVFLQLQPAPGVATLIDAIDATFALPDLRISQHERDLLETERTLAKAGGWSHDVRAVAFVPRSQLDHLPPFWRVLNVGPAVAMPPIASPPTGQDLCAVSGDLDPGLPVIAVIDDGIGFLNARFRRAPDRTRIRRGDRRASCRGRRGGGGLSSGQPRTAAGDRRGADQSAHGPWHPCS